MPDETERPLVKHLRAEHNVLWAVDDSDELEHVHEQDHRIFHWEHTH